MKKGGSSAIYVRLMGGLGNQLFQYAMGRNLADEKGVDLLLDPRYVNRKAFKSGLAIELFNVRARILQDHELPLLPEWAWKLSRAVRRVWRPLLGFYHETAHCYDAGLTNQTIGLMLSGFWQSHKYFGLYQNLVNDLSMVVPLSGKQLELAARIANCTSVAVHVRRGDYVSNKKALNKHGLCSVGYYQHAVAHMEMKLPTPTFFVFSDDPQWVRDNIQLDNAVYVSDEGFAQEVDLMLISLCKHQIIANSSFSWWGAYLNQDENKCVIAPSPWFNDPSLVDTDMYPDHWIKVAK